MGVGARAERAERADLRMIEGVTTAARLIEAEGFPVRAGLDELVPGRRLKPGTTLATCGPGATSLALGLVAEAVRAGSFLGVVAPDSFNLAACIDAEIPLRRVVQFVLDPPREPGWAQQLAAVIEGFDLVLLVNPGPVPAGVARRLATRNQERGSVLVRVGDAPGGVQDDLTFTIGGSVWHGLGSGHGHLVSRQVNVVASGRRHPGAPRRHTLNLIGPPPDQAAVTDQRVGADQVGAGRYAGADIDRILDVELAAPVTDPRSRRGRRTGAGDQPSGA